MGVFEYLSVLLSVIIGLGVTHILAGLSKMIHHRKTFTLFWPHILWAFNILILIVIIWWGMFWWNGLEDWSFFRFLLLLVYGILLFLAAALLFPWDLSEDFDFDRYFFETRPWFFSILTAIWLIDIPETLLKSEIGVRELPQGYVVLVTTQLTFGVVGIFWSNRTFHKIAAVEWPVFLLSYLSVTTLAQIAN